MRYVVTGGPGVGKSTLVKELLDLGHIVVPEAARFVMMQEECKQNGVLPQTDLEGFQVLVARRQLELENRVIGGPVFFDRGIYDNIAYCRLGNVKIPFDVLNSRPNYSRVFILDPLLDYSTDAQRKESRAKSLLIHDAIRDVYRELGFELLSVPVCSVRDRAKFILDNL